MVLEEIVRPSLLTGESQGDVTCREFEASCGGAVGRSLCQAARTSAAAARTRTHGQENILQFMRQNKPDFQILRRYRRPLLIRFENTHRLILGDYVRSAQQC